MSTPYAPLQLTPEQLNYSESAQWTRILKQFGMDLRVSIPAIVQSFDTASQTVTVQIAIREVVRTSKGAQNIAIQPIGMVPVIFPSGGGFSLTLPLKPGDEGQLIFCDMCIDLWWKRGGVQNQLEQRRHDLTDCGFYPGGRSQPRALNNYSANSAQLRSDDGLTIVDVAETGLTLTAPLIGLNSTGNVNILASGTVNINGTHVVVASSASDTKIDGKVFLTHLHTGVQSGASNTGPVF